MILRENPSLKDKIDEEKKKFYRYKKEWVRKRRYERSGI
jgi:hypothetical protein